MKRFAKFIACLLVLSVIASLLSVVSFADDSSVIYENDAEKFVFIDDDDLFNNFKGLMPGDTVTQYITVKNNNIGSDYVNIYLRAELHDDSNPLSDDIAATETIETMNAFLSELSMTVWCNDNMIYSASPDQLDGLANNVLLGSFEYGDEKQLRVELEIPTSLGNEFQYAKGEVDWVFTVEEMYRSTNALITLWGNKYLDDKTPEQNDFRFALVNSRGEIIQITNNNGSYVSFYPMSLDPGTHTFTIYEINGGDEDIIYDDAVFKVYVYVRSETDATVRYISDSRNLAWFVFDNYTDEAEEIEDPIEPGSEDESDISADEEVSVDDEEPEEDVSSPLTGDDTNIVLWIALLLAGLLAMILVIVFDRKKKTKTN